MIKPPAAANASMYDATMKSGMTGQNVVSRINELMTSLKGSTKGSGRGRKPTYGTKQAAKVARAGVK